MGAFFYAHKREGKMDQRLINFSQAAQYIGIHETAFRERVRHGKIPANVIVRIGGRVHVDLVIFNKWLDSQRGTD